MRLAGRVALITGGSRGIGSAIAKALAKEGAQVVINYMTAECRALQVRSEIESFGGQALVVQADISNGEDVARMVKEGNETFGRIDILVNNAVHPIDYSPFQETTWEKFLPEINVAIKGTYECCRAVIPGMMERRWGRIINIGGSAQAHPWLTVYAYWIGKAGMMALAKALALEFGPYGITANSVLPGLIETEIHLEESAMKSRQQTREAHAKVIQEKQAIKRMGQAEDVAGAVVYFASEEASFVTGCALHASGGMILTPV